MNASARILVVGLLSAGVVAAAFGQGGKGGRGGPVERVVHQSALLDLPVREVTVFKDGHAFVLHEEELAANERGEIVLDSLPSPVLGTFWSYSASEGVALKSVTAGTREVLCDEPVRSIRDILEANIGREAFIQETSGDRYVATVVGFPAEAKLRDDAPPQPGPQGRAPAAAPASEYVLLRTMQGTRFVHVAQIRDVTFRDDPQTTVERKQSRNLLTLRLARGDGAAVDKARVGMVYLQRGIRWIPNYRIEIDGAGSATVKLQATLINEMVDLENVTAHLVIGVPTFRFAHTLDPISLQQAVAQLSQYFAQQREQNQFNQSLSNAIMTQTARMGEYSPPGMDDGGVVDSVEVAESSRSEDLFIFQVDGITVRKGERIVVPVTEFTVPYEDVFKLIVPLTPPLEVTTSFNSQQQVELARLFESPKAMHNIRLKNTSRYPLTTAPALILRDGRLLAQGMMTYTAVGAATDLEVTTAVDIPVSREDLETQRNLNAAQWHGTQLARIQLEGTLTLRNLRGKPVRVEVTRLVLGNIDSADRDGEITRSNTLEEARYLTSGGKPVWWMWYNWPQWWSRFNGIGRVDWTVELAPEERVELKYAWHYYW